MANAGRWGMWAAKTALGASLLSFNAGCSIMSALTNPKAAWALQEPAPMAVVLRRADAARMTANNVDRLLGSTGVDEKSRWVLKIGLKKSEVEKTLKAIGTDAEYAPPAKGGKLRVITAEAWAVSLSSLCVKETKYTSLWASVSADVSTAYDDVSSQSKKIAKLKADKEAEDKAKDEPGASDADKDGHDKKKKEIDEEIGKLEADYKPKVEAFLTKLKEDAGNAKPEVKAQMTVAIVALKRAIDDAKLANSVALLRYPLAMPGMPEEIKVTAKRIVADVVEDKTGHRPILDKFAPEAKIDGGGVTLSLQGLPPEAIGKMKPDQILKEVTDRAKTWVTRVLTLTMYVGETQEMLELESQVMQAALDGFAADEAKVTTAGEDLGDLKVELDAVAAANASAGSVTTKGGKSSRHRVPTTMCGVAAAGSSPGASAADDDDDDDADDSDGKKGKKGGKKGGKKAEHKGGGHEEHKGEAKKEEKKEAPKKEAPKKEAPKKK